MFGQNFLSRTKTDHRNYDVASNKKSLEGTRYTFFRPSSAHSTCPPKVLRYLVPSKNSRPGPLKITDSDFSQIQHGWWLADWWRLVGWFRMLAYTQSDPFHWGFVGWRCWCTTKWKITSSPPRLMKLSSPPLYLKVVTHQKNLSILPTRVTPYCHAKTPWEGLDIAQDPHPTRTFYSLCWRSSPAEIRRSTARLLTPLDLCVFCCYEPPSLKHL